MQITKITLLDLWLVNNMKRFSHNGRVTLQGVPVFYYGFQLGKEVLRLITPRPDFIDSEFFVSDESGWRLLPGAPREIKREFRAFIRLTKEPFVNKKIDFRDCCVARRSGRRWRRP